jgi:hypothetical protein
MKTTQQAFADDLPEYTLVETGEVLDSTVVNQRVAELDAIDNTATGWIPPVERTIAGRVALAFDDEPTPLFDHLTATLPAFSRLAWDDGVRRLEELIREDIETEHLAAEAEQWREVASDA